MSKKVFFILIFLIFFGCDRNDQQELGINIFSTHTEKQWIFGKSEWGRVAVVNYRAENVGTKKINGWKVFFNIYVNDGPQLIGYEGVYYSLEPHDTTEVRTVECIIPEYYEDAYKSTLKHLETW